MSDEKWAYSSDGETFTGTFDTWWDAVLEESGDGITVGRAVTPIPEDVGGFADEVIEHIQIQDDYCGDWAIGWPNASQAQIDELDAEIGRTVGAWLDRHGLRPRFFVVRNSKYRTREEALEAEKAAEAGTPTGDPTP